VQQEKRKVHVQGITKQNRANKQKEMKTKHRELGRERVVEDRVGGAQCRTGTHHDRTEKEQGKNTGLRMTP